MLRDAYSEWARGQFTRADMFTENVEFVLSGPEPRTYLGPEGVREGWSDWLSAWQDFRTEDMEILDGAAEGVYVVFVRLTARGKESSVPIDAKGANVVVMRDGKIARFEIHWNRDEALAAAGLTRP